LKISSEEKGLKFVYEELSEKTGIFKKFISNFINTTKENNNVYVLDPFNYSVFKRNNKKNNILFLVNEEYFKRIEFNLTSKNIEPEVKFFYIN
jgi:hypothetical protein